METLKNVLAEAQERVAKEQAAREKHEARVREVQQELQDVVNKCESLERKFADQESELAKARLSAQEARVEAQGALQEIQEARKIAAGKAFIMQRRYVRKRYLLLTRIWSSPGAFADLLCSVADAAEFFRAEEGSSTKKLFWSQYLALEHPVPLSDQLKQLIELHRLAELAMKDLIIRLWPVEAIPAATSGS